MRIFIVTLITVLISSTAFAGPFTAVAKEKQQADDQAYKEMKDKDRKARQLKEKQEREEARAREQLEFQADQTRVSKAIQGESGTQKIIFNCENFEYNRRTKASQCEKKCRVESFDIESFLTSGWKIITVIPNQELIIEKMDEGGPVTIPGPTSTSPGHTMYFEPTGCICKGNKYVLEKM